MMTMNLTTAVRPAPAMGRRELDVTTLDTYTLACWSQEESRLFYRHEEHDPRFAYELFRRALVERDEIAWEYIFSIYSPLVDHWIRRTGAFTCASESSEFYISAAFARFWKAIPAHRFNAFPTLASLLNYLRRCSSCVVIDSVRSLSTADLVPEEAVSYQLQSDSCPDEEVTEQISREEFWKLISAYLNTEAERVVIFNSFILAMKPAAIFDARSDLFADVAEVYMIKRNALSRLRRVPELRDLYENE